MTEPLTREQLEAMSAEQVADQLATPAGRAEVSRVLSGGRVVTEDMLRDPSQLTTQEVADHWQQDSGRGTKVTAIVAPVHLCRKCKKRPRQVFSTGRVGAYCRDCDLRVDRAYYNAHRAEQACRDAAFKFGEVVLIEVWRPIWAGTCFSCGKTPAEGVDHIVPRSKGGRNVAANLQPACLPCNLSKFTKERTR